MLRFHLFILAATLPIVMLAGESTKPLVISFQDDGGAKNEIPALKPGDDVTFILPPKTTLVYEFSPDIGDGKVIPPCAARSYQDSRKSIHVPDDARIHIEGTEATSSRPIRALYYNLVGPVSHNGADSAKLTDLQSEHDYYVNLGGPLSWTQKKQLQEDIATENDTISSLQEEIKAFTGMSLPTAVDAIERRQQQIRSLRGEIKAQQKRIDNSGYQDRIDALDKQIGELKAKIDSNAKPQLLRAGVIVVGENRKPVYYALNKTTDASAPWLLKRYQRFPVLTTDDVPYVVVLGQQYGQDPRALRATFTSKAGSYIDADPVRPVLTQASTPSSTKKLEVKVLELAARPANCDTAEPPTFAYVDRVLQFTDRLAGETVYTVTVSGYGLATKDDTIMVTTGTTKSTQHVTTQANMTLNPLPGDAWPQVHSLYRYNLATGVIWSPDRIPSFPRVATGSFLPTGCIPNSTITAAGAASSSTTGTTTTTSGGTTTTTGATTTGAPSASTATTCLPTYQTLTVKQQAGVMPVVTFSRYWHKRDTQTKKGSWWWALPAPTIGLSLSGPTTDFFLGGSSEFPFLRNVQLVYGAHLARVPSLSISSFQNPTDSTAPQTTTSLQAGEFIGLTFNLDFIKGLFKP